MPRAVKTRRFARAPVAPPPETHLSSMSAIAYGWDSSYSEGIGVSSDCPLSGNRWRYYSSPYSCLHAGDIGDISVHFFFSFPHASVNSCK